MLLKLYLVTLCLTVTEVNGTKQGHFAAVTGNKLSGDT